MEPLFLEKSGLSIGDTIRLDTGTGDFEDALARREFTIVGTADSPLYISVERGSSSLGTGAVSAFVLLPQAAFSLGYYTDAYLRAEGAEELLCYSEDYTELVNSLSDALEPLAEERSALRGESIREEAEQALADARRELSDGEAEVSQELSEGEAELTDARRELDDGWAEYYDGLNTFEQETADAQREIDDGEAELADALTELRDGEQEYQDALPELEDARREVADARQELAEDIAFHQAVQFWFFSQWKALKDHANGLGVRIIGDLPIYVSLDSADVWSERKEFLLDETGRPSRVAGVPPDYFSAEGQLWGNPLYDWAAMKRDGFGWWIRRVEGASRLFDAIRIDHFRAFERYWSIPAGAETAKEGQWEPGPGMDLLRVLTGWFPHITYIAEDLGLLTPEVHQLREAAGLPGMKVLEFAFSGPGNDYLPHNYGSRRCVCYTGTHDNDTALGWYDHAGEAERAFAERYLGASGRENVRQALLRCGMGSTAELFVAQMQDYLALGSEGRINVPGVAEGNWRWRMAPGAAAAGLAVDIRRLTEVYGRC